MMSDIIFRYESLLENIARLRAELEVNNMKDAAASLLTTENDLIWQLHEISRFEEV